jgi:hypothetical protein
MYVTVFAIAPPLTSSNSACEYRQMFFRMFSEAADGRVTGLALSYAVAAASVG